ncbi:hypothetical protein Btru_059277 [Bulinus truncatus]|nr:hypothetical protein Btru_059277 [Bulinus truncatus]
MRGEPCVCWQVKLTIFSTTFPLTQNSSHLETLGGLQPRDMVIIVIGVTIVVVILASRSLLHPVSRTLGIDSRLVHGILEEYVWSSRSLKKLGR